MVRVEIRKAPLLSVKAVGHAGAGARGSDPVCAGVSTLLCTLAAQLTLTDAEHFAKLEPGDAILRAVKTPQTEAAFAFAETGLSLLAANFPQCVRLTER